ncbi:MAG: hypothetical protein ACYTBV_19415 [Planctomycetota bacterium]|jgi:hypothetical protein
MIAEIIPALAAEGQDGRGKFKPRPSMAGPVRCSRSMVYHALEYPPEPFPGRAFLIFDDGIWHEELTLDWLRKSAFRPHSEQMTVNCRPPMDKGHIDCLVGNALNEDIHIEHKAINHFTFQRFWNSEDPIDYLTQTAIYNEAIQRELNPECKRSILLIKNKNTAQYLEFLCEYNLELDILTLCSKTLSTGETQTVNVEFTNIVDNACDKFNKVLAYAEQKILPKRPYEIDDWHCEYCGWAKTCWEGYEKEFDSFKTGELAAQEVKRYKQLGSEKSIITKQYDETRDTIKSMMIGNELKQAVAGDYLCKLTLTKDKKHRLYISKLKTKE